MLNESNHAGKKAVIDAYNKRHGDEKMIKLYDGGSSFLDEIDEDQKVQNIKLRNKDINDEIGYNLNQEYKQNNELLF